MSRTRQRATSAPSPAAPAEISGTRALAVPVLLALALFLISLVPRVAEHPVLAWSFWTATATLLLWQGALLQRWRSSSDRPAVSRPSLILAPPRAQHYVQAACQLSVYLYWGWYWLPVYDYAWLLVAQILFAYAFDMLLSWTRRDSFVLGFGPFPIIFSTNLFLWFKDEWFYLQFVLVAVGFLGKEFVRWHREGRLVHIFNPSAFSLGLCSIVLIATGTTHLTWGPEIASTLSLAPHIYVFLFVVGLVVMYFFAVTLVAASAAAVLFGLSALYTSSTGVPYFLDSEIPAAVFLGLHLLVTDPSTSPRTSIGKLVFGILYGCGVFFLYTLLGTMGAPTFYDKLLCVPLLNLCVPSVDRAVRAIGDRPVLARLGLGGVPGRSNPAHIGTWMVFFALMTVTGRTDGRHLGDSLPFWQEACETGRVSACSRLLQLETTYCRDGSGWACNELGGHFQQGTITAADPEVAFAYFARACEVRFQAGCVNLLEADRFRQSNPRPVDFRLLLREGGLNLLDMPEPNLYARACDHGWSFACAQDPAGGSN
jgi:hypothetical protein